MMLVGKDYKPPTKKGKRIGLLLLILFLLSLFASKVIKEIEYRMNEHDHPYSDEYNFNGLTDKEYENWFNKHYPIIKENVESILIAQITYKNGDRKFAMIPYDESIQTLKEQYHELEMEEPSNKELLAIHIELEEHLNEFVNDGFDARGGYLHYDDRSVLEKFGEQSAESDYIFNLLEKINSFVNRF